MGMDESAEMGVSNISLHHSLSVPSCMCVSTIWIMDIRMGIYKVMVIELMPVDYAR